MCILWFHPLLSTKSLSPCHDCFACVYNILLEAGWYATNLSSIYMIEPVTVGSDYNLFLLRKSSLNSVGNNILFIHAFLCRKYILWNWLENSNVFFPGNKYSKNNHATTTLSSEAHVYGIYPEENVKLLCYSLLVMSVTLLRAISFLTYSIVDNGRHLQWSLLTCWWHHGWIMAPLRNCSIKYAPIRMLPDHYCSVFMPLSWLFPINRWFVTCSKGCYELCVQQNAGGVVVNDFWQVESVSPPGTISYNGMPL